MKVLPKAVCDKCGRTITLYSSQRSDWRLRSHMNPRGGFCYGAATHPASAESGKEKSE